jgi:hypothetical protein
MGSQSSPSNAPKLFQTISTSPTGLSQRSHPHRSGRRLSRARGNLDRPPWLWLRRPSRGGRANAPIGYHELISVRPEVRCEYAFSARPWDNGTRKGQLIFATDVFLQF